MNNSDNLGDDAYIPYYERLPRFLQAFPPRFTNPDGGPDLPGWYVRTTSRLADIKLVYADAEGTRAENTLEVTATLYTPSGQPHATASTLAIVDEPFQYEAAETNACNRLLSRLGFAPKAGLSDDEQASMGATRTVPPKRQKGEKSKPAGEKVSALRSVSKSDQAPGLEGLSIKLDAPSRKPTSASAETGATAEEATTESPAAESGADETNVQEIGIPPASIPTMTADLLRQRAAAAGKPVDWTTIKSPLDVVAALKALDEAA